MSKDQPENRKALLQQKADYRGNAVGLLLLDVRIRREMIHHSSVVHSIRERACRRVHKAPVRCRYSCLMWGYRKTGPGSMKDPIPLAKLRPVNSD